MKQLDRGLRYAATLRSGADEHLVAETLDKSDEQRAVAAGLNADDHVAREARVEIAEDIRLMIQLGSVAKIDWKQGRS